MVWRKATDDDETDEGLVVALVAGGVIAPVPSQAGEVDGKAIMCEEKLDRLTGQP